MRKIESKDGKLEIIDDIDLIFEKIVTRFGNGSKIDCPKEFLGRRVYVLIRKGD